LLVTWANEVPLPAAKVTRTRDQGDGLIDMLGATAKPSCFRVAQVGRDGCDCSAAGPLEQGWPGIVSGSHRSLPNETIQVQRQAPVRVSPLGSRAGVSLFDLACRGDWTGQIEPPSCYRLREQQVLMSNARSRHIIARELPMAATLVFPSLSSCGFETKIAVIPMPHSRIFRSESHFRTH
jgi:hypothetical protein